MTEQWTWRAGALTDAEGNDLASVRDGVLATAAATIGPRFFWAVSFARYAVAPCGEPFSESKYSSLPGATASCS